MLVIILKEILNEGLDGYLINTSDEHNNEYIGISDERLKHVTKFTGSNGLALISSNGKFLWTDGRYHIQAENELTKEMELIKVRKDFYAKIKNLRRVGMNMKHFSTAEFKNLKSNCEDTVFIHFDLEEVYNMAPIKFNEIINLEDISLSKFFNERHLKVVKEHYTWFDYKLLDLKNNVTGGQRKNKIRIIQDRLGKDDVLIVTLLDEIAWLLNLRGQDIEYNPVFYSFMIISKDCINLFVGHKVQLENVENVEKVEQIEIYDYTEFYKEIERIENKNILISNDCNQYLYDTLSGKNKVKFDTFLRETKSKKNMYEVFGFIMSHVYDGIALSILFEWMEDTLRNASLTELDVSDQLVQIKSQIEGYFSPSFETISATGENSAIIHHKGSEKAINTKDLFLIDSGTQYFFGTTDVTRTLSFTNPTEEQKNDFTTVLKGQINAMTAVIHKRYKSSLLDGLTRLPIWEQNEVEDFEHSTGHGVGHFLNVHESPPNISENGEKLEENMIFSIEPGLYKKGKHGIRIEDLVIVKSFNDTKFNMKNLTLAPLQMKMINFDMLDQHHKTYIKEFNARVRSVLGEFIKEGQAGHRFLTCNTVQ